MDSAVLFYAGAKAKAKGYNLAFTITNTSRQYQSVRVSLCDPNDAGTIDWGDGYVDLLPYAVDDIYATLQHTYARVGTYHVRMSFSNARYLRLASVGNIVSIDDWSGFSFDCGDSFDSAGLYGATFPPTLPSGIKTIPDLCFYQGYNLALASLPSSIEEIGCYAFFRCYNITLSTLPKNLKRIGARAFANCTGLSSLTFSGKPDIIAKKAFSGCTNLVSIRVPWAEGEVANAPWGATNAVITYNYSPLLAG